ncbi:MAG: histidine phosphatase family protein [Nitriliruptorales bacterium]|nr:histidine phosphatase family protein [Nitriliruptorales bacterium]
MSTKDASTEYRQFRFALPSGATDILLIRHGESAPARLESPFPMVDGQSDPELDPRGREEADRVADRLAGEELAAIYVTTLRRTAETAAPLARRSGLEPRVEPDMREVNLGKWEGGLFRARVAEAHPTARLMFAQERWDVIPGAERQEAFMTRVRAGVERIATAHRDQRVAVFTHGGVIATVMCLATGCRPFAFVGADNGSITHLVVTADHWIVRRFNDTGHLGTDLDRPPQPLT